jgi:alpha-D-ribose 1-methylphosphonate 5-triphosphate synthase subunit PhnI
MLSYEQMIDELENIEQAAGDYSEDYNLVLEQEDLDAMLIEAIDRACRRGAITSEVHDRLYWQFGFEI